MAIDMAALRAKALANAARVLAEEKKNDENTTSVSVPSPVLATAPIVSTSPAVSRNMAILESSIATANSMVPVSWQLQLNQIMDPYQPRKELQSQPFGKV